MAKNGWLIAISLFLGSIQAHAGWVYQDEGFSDEEIAYESELDLSETLGKIEEGLDSDSLVYQDDALLPWGIDESVREDFSALVEEGPSRHSEEVVEKYGVDSSSEEWASDPLLPSLERIPSRRAGVVAGRPKIVESQPVHPPLKAQKRTLSKQAPLASKKGYEKSSSLKKSPRLAQTPQGRKQPRSASKVPSAPGARSQASSKVRKPAEMVQKERSQSSQKKSSVSTIRPKRQRPTERLAQKEPGLKVGKGS